jgi:hypothetical protein
MITLFGEIDVEELPAPFFKRRPERLEMGVLRERLSIL